MQRNKLYFQRMTIFFFILQILLPKKVQLKRSFRKNGTKSMLIVSFLEKKNVVIYDTQGVLFNVVVEKLSLLVVDLNQYTSTCISIFLYHNKEFSINIHDRILNLYLTIFYSFKTFYATPSIQKCQYTCMYL